MSYYYNFTLQSNLSMATNHTNWTYNEFLAFMLLYAASVDCDLTPEELGFIKSITAISDIDKIKDVICNVSDAEVLDIIETYRPQYMATKEKEQVAITDLEQLLKTPGAHSQLERVGVHMLEKIIRTK